MQPSNLPLKPFLPAHLFKTYFLPTYCEPGGVQSTGSRMHMVLADGSQINNWGSSSSHLWLSVVKRAGCKESEYLGSGPVWGPASMCWRTCRGWRGGCGRGGCGRWCSRPGNCSRQMSRVCDGAAGKGRARWQMPHKPPETILASSWSRATQYAGYMGGVWAAVSCWTLSSRCTQFRWPPFWEAFHKRPQPEPTSRICARGPLVTSPRPWDSGLRRCDPPWTCAPVGGLMLLRLLWHGSSSRVFITVVCASASLLAP